VSIFFDRVRIQSQKERVLFQPAVWLFAMPLRGNDPSSHSRASHLRVGLTNPPTSCPPTLRESNDLPQLSLGLTSSNTSARFVRFGSLALSLPNVHRASPSSFPLMLMPRHQPRCVHQPFAHTRRAQPLCSHTLLKPWGRNVMSELHFTVHARLLTLHVRYI